MPEVGKYTLTQQYVTQQSEDWGRALQQVNSALEGCATHIAGIVQGKEYKFNRVNPIELNETPLGSPDGATPLARGRHQDIAIDELSTVNGYMVPQEFDKHLWGEYDDASQLGGIDITIRNAIPELRSAYARMLDQVLLGVVVDKVSASKTYGKFIIDKASVRYKQGGIFGQTAYGLTSGTADRMALPDAAVIAATIGGATADAATGLNIKKILRAKRMLAERFAIGSGIVNSEKTVMIVTQEMVTQLIEDEERLGSSEYGFCALQSGTVTELAGVTFIQTETLPFVKNADGSYSRRAVMYPVSRLLVGTWSDFNIEVKDQPGKKKSYTVGGSTMVGSARKDEVSFITVDSLTDLVI